MSHKPDAPTGRYPRCVRHVFSSWTSADRGDGVPRLVKVCYQCEAVRWEDDVWDPSEAEAA